MPFTPSSPERPVTSDEPTTGGAAVQAEAASGAASTAASPHRVVRREGIATERKGEP
jgi:hypothetical protein